MEAISMFQSKGNGHFLIPSCGRYRDLNCCLQWSNTTIEPFRTTSRNRNNGCGSYHLTVHDDRRGRHITLLPRGRMTLEINWPGKNAGGRHLYRDFNGGNSRCTRV